MDDVRAEELAKAFPALNPGIIRHAAFNNPSSARQAIEDLLAGKRSLGPYSLIEGKIVCYQNALDDDEAMVDIQDFDMELNPAP